MPRSSRSSSTPNCTKGYSCGSSCIQKSKNCANAIEGQARTYTEWLRNSVIQGRVLSNYHRDEIQSQINSGGLSSQEKAVAENYLRNTPAAAGRQTAAQRREAERQTAVRRQEAARQASAEAERNRRRAERPASSERANVPRPAGVRRTKSGNTITYSFKAGGEKVAMSVYTFETPSGSIANVSFQVGGSYRMSSLSPEARNEASVKLSKLIQHHASTLPDGSEINCSAYEDDGQGSYRVLAYTRMGFSRPFHAEPGYSQYGVIRNGRLDPEASQEKLKQMERDNYETYQRAWENQLEQVRQSRQNARAARRAA